MISWVNDILKTWFSTHDAPEETDPYLIDKHRSYSLAEEEIILPEGPGMGRSLIIGHYSATLTEKSEFFQFGNKTVQEDVFKHFSPSVEVELRDIDGNTVKQKVAFQSLSDFEREGLIENAYLLKQQIISSTTLIRFNEQWKENLLFHELIINDEKRALFFELIDFISQNLLRKNIEKQASEFGKKICSILETMEGYWGWKFLCSLDRRFEFLNPKIQVNFSYFLSDNLEYRNIKLKLLFHLRDLNEVVRKSGSEKEMEELARKWSSKNEDLLNKNLLKVYSATSDLEKSYRALDAFLKTPSGKTSQIVLCNSSTAKFQAPLDSHVFDLVKELVLNTYKGQDLSDNFTFLVIPTSLKDYSYLEKWKRLAKETKCVLITGFTELESTGELLEETKNQFLKPFTLPSERK